MAKPKPALTVDSDSFAGIPEAIHALSEAARSSRDDELIRADKWLVMQGGAAVAAVFNRAGDRLYVRTTGTVEAFDFNPFDGTMKADWTQQLSFSAEYFGIDQIAIDLDSGNIYVDGGRMLLILDPQSGRQTGSVQTGDATGVCFAQRQAHAPIREFVSITP